MTDTSIIKSQTYTIIDEFMTLAVPILGHDTFKLILNDITPISYYVVEIPFMFSSDDIRSLSDIEKIGGRIIGQVGSGITFRSPPPSPVLPPSGEPSTACAPPPAARIAP
jgi:hypothetical protein